MSRTYRGDEKRLRVRGVRKDPVDLRRLARALIALAQAQAEADAQAAGNDTMSIDQTNGKTTDNTNGMSIMVAKMNANANTIPLVIGISTTDDGDAE